MTNRNNAMELSNVSISKNLMEKTQKNDTPPTYGFGGILGEAIWKLAGMYPLWKFEATKVDAYSLGSIKFTQFTVYSNGEDLGSISTDTYTGKYALRISNERIRKELDRKSYYITTNLNNAVLKVKKMFRPKSVAERVQEANKIARECISGIWSDGNSKLRQIEGKVQRASIQYVNNVALDSFVQHIRENDNSLYLELLEKNKLDKERVEINKIIQDFDSKNTSLIIRGDNGYIIERKDNISITTDEELSHELRAKLGMLKLVEPNIVIDNIGYKVDDKTFVILHNKEESA